MTRSGAAGDTRRVGIATRDRGVGERGGSSMSDRKSALISGSLGAVVAALLLGVPSSAEASCLACNVASRACRQAAQLEFRACKIECRLANPGGDEDGAREACFLGCEAARTADRAICDTDRETCRAACEGAQEAAASAEEAACPGACAAPLRDCLGVVRDDRRACLGDCREGALAAKDACLGGPPASLGECLGAAGMALGTCLHGCASSSADGVAVCSADLRACIEACP